jgi:hypothetical protein
MSSFSLTVGWFNICLEQRPRHRFTSALRVLVCHLVICPDMEMGRSNGAHTAHNPKKHRFRLLLLPVYRRYNDDLDVLHTDMDPSSILNSGATDFRNFISLEILRDVLVAYNSALTTAYNIAIAASCLSVLGALTME